MQDQGPESTPLALPAPHSAERPYPSFPGGEGPFENPGSGRVAAGTAAGAALGMGLGLGISRLLFGAEPSDTGEVTGETQEEANANADAKIATLQKEFAGWSRRRRVVVGLLTTLGSMAGAGAAADEGEKARAAVGAGVGSAVVHTANVVAQPKVGLPGIGASALGAVLATRNA